MTVLKSYKISRSGFGKALLVSLFVAGLLIAMYQLSMRAGLDESQRVVGDLVGGLLAGSIIYMHERRRDENDRINELANHHIRNALQPLMFLQYEPAKAAQEEIVDTCIRRIDWTLKEILPGKSKEPFWNAHEQYLQEFPPRYQSTRLSVPLQNEML